MTSVSGTANEITASAPTGAVTLSIPSAFQLPGTINKLTLTQPATGATVTIADGKTFTDSNTLILTGTDGSSVAFGTGGTVSYAAGANPSATAGPTAVNGTSANFMRADGAPAIQLGSSSQKGIVEVDNSTITASSGVISTAASATLDTLGSTQGDVLYRSASAWTVLAPGSSGFFLKTQGTAANPTWAAASGGSGCSTGGSAGNLLTADGAGSCTTVTVSSLVNGALSLGSSGTAGSIALGNASTGTVTLQTVSGALGSVTASLPANTGTIAETNLAQTFSAAQTFSSAAPQIILGVNTTTLGAVKMFGNTSGDLTINPAAVAGTSSVITFPAGITNFSATGGTSQVVKQTSSGGAFTVARLACADLSDSNTGCSSAAGTGTVTSVATNNGLTGGTITTTGTIGLAAIAADNLLANSTGGSAAPIATSIGSCSTGSSALTYNTSTHAFGCNSISGGSGLTVGTTTITSGTNTRVEFNNSGVLGEYAISGSGNVAMTTSPSFTTPALGAATGTSLSTTGAHTAFNATAIPTGGTAGGGFLFSSTANNGLFFGTGAPTLTAAEGSLYLRNDTGHPYYNSTGSTTWVDLAAGGGGTGCVPAGSVNEILTDSGSGTCTSNASTLTSSAFVSGAASATPQAFSLQFGASSRGGTDTDTAGASGTITSGAGTGAGTISALIFQTPTVGSTGTTQQTLATRLTLNTNSASFSEALTTTGNLTAAGAIVNLTNAAPTLETSAGSTTVLKFQAGSSGGVVSLGTTTGNSALQIGAAQSASPAANTVIIGENSRSGTDTNVAGSNGTITSGRGTGNATGASLVFQTPAPTTSGTGAQTQTTQLTVNNAGATFVPPVALAAGTAGSPALYFGGDTSTGFYRSAANNIAVAVGGVERFFYSNALFLGLSASGPGLQNQAASSTAPTLIPNESDLTTGIGAQASGNLSLIAGATEVVRVTSTSFNLPGLTQTSAAQTGTLCYNSTAPGAVTYDATLGCLTSLEEYKDIKPGGIKNAEAEVNALKPFWYTWKTTSPEWKADKQEQPGLGAHATEKVDPRLVGYGPDGKLRGVRYAQTVALLIADLQEQSGEIAELKKQNAELSAAVARLAPQKLPLSPVSLTRH